MHRRQLPIGIQTFAKIREADHYYVDKTGFIRRLIEEGSQYFLSRPRRFGKSLLIDTIAELFAGNEPLFRGLLIHPHWDWTVRYPVIRVSFGGGVVRSRAELDEKIRELLDDNAGRLKLTVEASTLSGRLGRLIQQAHAATGQRVVVLVDEYDKPILDNLTDRETASAMRDGLRNLYSVIKDNDAHIRFAFLTGVSKFSKVSIFSGLNNLKDITVDARYSALCGYTEEDVDTVFAPELDGLDRAQIRAWYNGYNWTGEAVYNPFDLLLLFDAREFRTWWFETGTPTFLVDLLTERGFFTPRLAHLRADEALLSAFDVDHLTPEALLWQTGYLTFTGSRRLGARLEYTLGYPNLEVESALNDSLAKALIGQPGQASELASRLYDVLVAGDLDALRAHVESLFAAIPHQWHTANPIARFEGYYASVFYSHLAALGLDLTAEDATQLGRIDLTLKFNARIWLFEFKVVELAPEGRALQQLKERGYADKYRSRCEPIHLIGIEFSRERRTLVGFETETL
ncbi:ATP-binding protein [Thiocapsa rosea]|uniref:PD-(D/E)XK nuclease superfamily protein n=1 Tax=Thiocapsa rosea TaxID=69360 RepID=A0A495V3W9_9GAMM|nr:ATP-binding protein [Thiocapsa rosea]RKT43994.1 PD-(D/E)XK nuclease superfamily protein [Thiocapsa rosea]